MDGHFLFQFLSGVGLMDPRLANFCLERDKYFKIHIWQKWKSSDNAGIWLALSELFVAFLALMQFSFQQTSKNFDFPSLISWIILSGMRVVFKEVFEVGLFNQRPYWCSILLLSFTNSRFIRKWKIKLNCCMWEKSIM